MSDPFENLDNEVYLDKIKNLESIINLYGDNQDVNRFKPVTEEYVKPEVGTMLVFPNWLRHAVMPFYGDGERRTFSANINIFENSSFENISEEDKIKHIEMMRK